LKNARKAQLQLATTILGARVLSSYMYVVDPLMMKRVVLVLFS
jgi:hypothetical protein